MKILAISLVTWTSVSGAFSPTENDFNQSSVGLSVETALTNGAGSFGLVVGYNNYLCF